MKIKTLMVMGLLLFGLSTTLVSCGGEDDDEDTIAENEEDDDGDDTEEETGSDTEVTQNIAQLASATDSLSTLVTLLQSADLVTTLSGTDNFTVFAPTNEAFAAIQFRFRWKNSNSSR